MDLRKSVLKRQQNVLGESLCSLNSSNLSSYESALEDSDCTLYYSFDNTSKSLNDTGSEIESLSNNSITSVCSEVDNKENTVIMREIESPSGHDKSNPIAKKDDRETITNKPSTSTSNDTLPTELPSAKQANDLPETSDENERRFEQQAEVSVAVCVHQKELEASATILIDEKVSTLSAQPNQENTAMNKQKTEQFVASPSIPDIVVSEAMDDFPEIETVATDPNENVVNPFTAPVGEVPDALFEVPIPKPSADAKNRKTMIPANKRATRQSSAASKLQPAHRVYSPVMRKSLERKSKAVSKLAANRRTIYEVSKPGQPRRSGGSRSPKRSKAAIKPKVYKCSVQDCGSEFQTIRAFQEHQKTHKSASSSTLQCAYCDKKFQLQAAFLTHQIENCTKIPFNEKRKLIAKRETTEPDRRRTAMFLAPAPKLKSPGRKKVTNESLNKSGVKCTPKKALKCFYCPMIFDNAVSLAEHIVTLHKRNKENPTA